MLTAFVGVCCFFALFLTLAAVDRSERGLDGMISADFLRKMSTAHPAVEYLLIELSIPYSGALFNYL